MNILKQQLETHLFDKDEHRPAPLWSFCEFGAITDGTYLLTYLLTYFYLFFVLYIFR